MNALCKTMISLLLISAPVLVTAATDYREPIDVNQVINTMKTASRFMVDEVSDNGGYVWVYDVDGKRRWGELEAEPGMVWVQAPSTPGMGHVFLDAWSLTEDPFYLNAAKSVADALVEGQQDAGGWNYFFHRQGDAAKKQWYETVGANAWRFEEFHHDYGNGTFDDGGTIDAASLLLRISLITSENRYKTALNRAIDYVLSSQQPVGGWPQRFPPAPKHSFHGLADYSGLITLNDNVAGRNISFLLSCYFALEREDLLEPIYRAMHATRILQMGEPQPGWALQYDQLLHPRGARSYEPESLSPPTTAHAISEMLEYYRLTGDSRFLMGVPAAINWLEQLKLPEELVDDGRDFPRIVELGTNRPMYLHRQGTNIHNGHYFIDYNPESTVIHYRSRGHLDLARLRKAYDHEIRRSVDPTPFMSRQRDRTAFVDEFVRTGRSAESFIDVSDGRGWLPCARDSHMAATAQESIRTLNKQGYWPLLSGFTSNPYRHLEEGTSRSPVAPSTETRFASTWVGDDSDTSTNCEGPVRPVISTAMYMHNMDILMDWLRTETAMVKRVTPKHADTLSALDVDGRS